MANGKNKSASEGRVGKRKDRNKRLGTREPELGYYLIVTDTEETEKNYFEGLRDSIPDELKDRLVIKVTRAKTSDLVKKTQDLIGSEVPYRIPWIVFDRDQVRDFDKIVELAEKSGIHVGWSNPCFEIWMHAYFGEMPAIKESSSCCSRFSENFKKFTGQEYRKGDRDIYRKLLQYGDEEKAIKIAEQCHKKCKGDGKTIPSEMWPASRVYELVAEIRGKIPL